MRNLPQNYYRPTGRPVTLGVRHMVAASHYLASAAGLNMLDQGGSAVDALITTNATLAVVYNHMAGLGGDLFAQVWDPATGNVTAMNGSGRSGAGVTIEAYRQKGWDEIQPRGPLAANTVPGVVDAWWKLHQRHGKLDWKTLFRPAIEYANGFPISPKLRDYIQQYADTLKQFDTTAQIFLPNGRAPEAGTIFRQPDLANSLTMIAEQGAEVFYRGELARKIVQELRNAGGLLSEDDFTSHSSEPWALVTGLLVSILTLVLYLFFV